MHEKWKKMYRNNVFLIRKIYGYNRILFFVRIGYSVLTSLSTLVSVLLPKFLLEALLANEIERVVLVLTVYSVVMLTLRFTGTAYDNYDKNASEKMYVTVINEFLRKGIELDLTFFDRSESYSKYNRGIGNCCNVIDSANRTFLSIIQSIIQIVMIAGVLVWADFYVFVVILVFLAVNITINNRLKKIDYEFSVAASKNNQQVNYFYRLLYVPNSIREIKANGMEQFIFEKKEEVNRKILALVKENMKTTTKSRIALNTLATVEYVLAALYFAFSVIIGKIVVSDYFTSVNAYEEIKNALNNLLSSYTEFYNNSLFADDYIDFMKSEENVTTNLNGTKIRSEEIREIAFSHVSFSYPNASTRALNDVSFSIRKGDKIAILGKNGAGKTTTIKLLLRLYDPDEGVITINGRDIREYNTQSLRTAIRVLFQDFTVYAFSIRDNVTLGRSISDAKLVGALEEVGLYEKLRNLEKGLDTPITSQFSKGGIELSGGETQKLAIARIYAADASFFVLDEPTSSLDPYAEYQLYNRLLKEERKESTCVVISHRLTLTHKMSKIIVIDNGSVAECGNHEELMRRNGIYAEMYRIQSEKYKGEAL